LVACLVILLVIWLVN